MRNLLARLWSSRSDDSAPPSLLSDPTPEPELSRRREAWTLLSDLWLDTEINTDYLAASLARLPYSVEQLDEICIFEVAPVLFPNLESVAGEWAGFDPTWLEQEISKAMTQADSRDGVWRRRKRTMHIAGDTWQEVRAKIDQIRSQAALNISPDRPRPG